jgi:predicted ATPase/DNA-binding CsgD family transcriptional regulator
MATRAVPAFMGRGRELETLEALLTDARAGNPSFALVVGEPGIGKTRTVQELAGSARAAGIHVLWSTCFDDDPRPFAPWVQVADEIVASTDPGELVDRLGAGASTAATVVPRLAEALPHLSPPAPLAPTESRFRVYDTLARLVAGVRREATLVVLDDLQWADAASLEFLAYIARTLEQEPLLLVGTAREVGLDHPLGHALADVERRLAVHRLLLPALPDEAIALLIEDVLGYRPSSHIVEAIAGETAGNPFFAVALVRHLAEEGHDLAADDVSAAIPGSVRDAVGRRLARLSPDAAQMLSVACAFSGPFRFEELQALTELDEELLLGALDEALEAAMLRPAAGDGYEFGHAIVRQALYEASNPSRQGRLHRRLAQALEQVHAGNEGQHAAELAIQYHRSRSFPGAARGAAYALAAADAAHERFAYEGAAEFLRMARDLAADSLASVRAEILTRLAVVEAEALLLERSRRTVDEAVDALEEAATDEPAIAAFLVEAAWALQEAGAEGQLVQPLVDRGLRLLGERRDLTWARLKLAEYPLEELRVGDVVAGRWLGFDPEAVAIARSRGQEHDYAKTVELMDWRARDETEELLALARRWKEGAAAIHVLSVVMRGLMHQHGAIHEAAEVAAELAAMSERCGSLPGEAYARVYLAWAMYDLGDLDEGRRRAEHAEELVRRLGPGHRLRFSVRFFKQRQLQSDERWGELAAFRMETARDPALPPWMAVLHLGLAARAYAEAGDEHRARDLLADLVPALARLDPRTLNQNGAVVNVAWAAWLLGAREHAPALHRLVLDLVDAGVGDYSGTSRELAVAWMATLENDRAAALEYLARARATLAASGQRPLLELVTETERAIRGGEGRELRPDKLTPRELEVLRALASGRSNKEIASELFLSVHTVERHVANVYRKISAHNRAQAAAYATRLEL